MNVTRWVMVHFIILTMGSQMERHGRYRHLTRHGRVNKGFMAVKLDKDFIQSSQFIDHKAMVVQVFTTTLPLFGKNNLHLGQEDRTALILHLRNMVTLHKISWNHLIWIKHSVMVLISLSHKMTTDSVKMLKLKYESKEENSVKIQN